MASDVGTSCTTTAFPCSRSVAIAGRRLGSLAESSSWAKKRCLTLSKRESAADFALALRVEPEALSMTRVASSAALRLRWMIAQASA